jgi:hypothetical protein
MNTFTTTQLVGIIQNLIRPKAGLLDRYFPTIVTFNTEEVHVDVVPGKRRVAPFVSPVVEGHIVESKGRTVNILKPAYIKPKMRFDPDRAFKRAVGEQIGGNLAPQQRFDLAISEDLEDLTEMIIRRKELMASEALRTGKVTITGEKYPTVVVDFLRAAANTVANLTTTARWPDAASKPLRNLRTWANIALKASGAYAIDAIMGVDALTEFMEHASVEKRFLQLNAGGTQALREAQMDEGLQYFGTVDRFNIFGYGGWYVDPADGVEKEIFPAKAVCMASPAVEGEQLQGAIRDPKAGFAPAELFPKMWDDEDPPERWLMVQSAPLVAPGRPDATVYVDNVVDA